ncbi:MAG: hypothetical protein ABL906_03945 [Sideroxydans sp.]
MKTSLSSIVMGGILLVTVVFPSIIFMVFHASSMATGILVVSLLYFCAFVMFNVAFLSHRNFFLCSLLIVAIMLGVLTHGLFNYLINEDFDAGRFFSSYLILFIYFLGAASFALLMHHISIVKTNFSVNLVFYVLLLSSIAGIMKYSPFSANLEKSVLFFSEPSHFALSFLPFLLYVAVISASGKRILFILSSYLIALLLENLTLVIGITLITSLVIPTKRLFLLALIAIILILFSSLNFDYYVSRADLSADSKSLSTLVFLSGWERAYQSLADTFGLGVGFQQFGIIGKEGDLMGVIEAMSGERLNLLDGGSIAPKFIGEFGVLGVILLLTYLTYFAKSIILLHKISMENVPHFQFTEIFFHACFVMYSVDLFIRGTGYFSSSGFFFVASILWMAIKQEHKQQMQVAKVPDAQAILR